MSITAFEQTDVHIHWLLTLAGVPWGWYSHGEPTGQPTDLSDNRTLARGLHLPSATDQSAELQEGLASGGSATCKIDLIPGNHADQLLRLGPRGADHNATLKVDIADQFVTPATIVVNEDISAWDASGYLHIGQECFTYSARTVATPWQFTCTGRGYFDSRVKGHLIRDIQGGPPYVRSDVTNWRLRPAVLWMASVPQGTLPVAGDWIQQVNGFIREAPEEVGRGTAVKVVVTPWMNAVDSPLDGVTDATSLINYKHPMGGEFANRLGGIHLAYERGAAYRERINSVDGTLKILTVNWDQHYAHFDPTESDGRRGDVQASTLPPERPDGTAPSAGNAYNGTSDDGTGTLTMGGAYTSVAANMLIENAFAIHSQGKIIVSTDTMLDWPMDALDIVNTGWDKDTVTESGGTFANCQFVFQDAKGGDVLKCRCNGSAPVKLWRSLQPSGSCWYGMSLKPKDGSRIPHMTLENWDEYNRDRWEASHTIQATRATPSTRDSFPIVGCARAFWQTGEKYILVTEDVFGNAPFQVRVEATDPDGTTFRQLMTISSIVTATSVFAGEDGYLLTVSEERRGRYRSFGNWPGRNRCVIRPVVGWRDTSPLTVITELLSSSEGDAYTSADDVQPYGLGFTDDELDFRAFERYPLPGGVVSEVAWYEITDAETVLDVIGSMLQLIGAVLHQRLDPATGKRLVTISPAAPATKFQSLASIGDGVWSPYNRPVATNQSAIENVLEVTPRDVDGEEPQAVRLENRAAAAEWGSSSSVSIAAPWLDIRSETAEGRKAALLPVAQDRWATFAHPRRVVTGSVPYRVAARLDAGVTVLVTASDARNYDGTVGVTEAVGTVVDIQQDPGMATCTLSVLLNHLQTSGWAPALDVTAITNVTTVVVGNNTYLQATDPVTGETIRDYHLFTAGDVVRVCPAGDYASSVALTIVSVSSAGSIALSGNHNLGANTDATIRPADWDSAGSNLTQYVFLCDEDGLLGAGDDEGYEYA